MNRPLQIILEFARAESAGQPYMFRFAAQSYLLRAPGGGFESVEFPWSPALLDDLRAMRAVDRDPAVLHRIGDILRDFLGPAGWATYEQAIIAASQAGLAIHVHVRSAAAELYALPWELLTLKSSGQMIGGISGLVIRYEWPATTTCPDVIPAADRRARVLFGWSAAGGAVPAADHLAALQRAFPVTFQPRRDVVKNASFAAIAEALERARGDGLPVDTLHLLCHGATAGSTFGLALDDADQPGERVVVDAGRLQQLIAPHAGMLRLVVLAACDGGNTGELGNHLGSVAQMIHRAGLRAVVASRFPLSTTGSSRLCDALYGHLAAGAPLEQAFIGAREVLLRDTGQLDWASIQLYSRVVDSDAGSPVPVIGPRPVSQTRAKLPWIAAGLAIAAATTLGIWRRSMDIDTSAGKAQPMSPGEPMARPEVPSVDASKVVAVAEPARDPHIATTTDVSSREKSPRDRPQTKDATETRRVPVGSPTSVPRPEQTAPAASVSRENLLRVLGRAPGLKDVLTECEHKFAEIMGHPVRERDYPITVERTAEGRWRIQVPMAKQDISWSCFRGAVKDALDRDRTHWAEGIGQAQLDVRDLLEVLP